MGDLMERIAPRILAILYSVLLSGGTLFAILMIARAFQEYRIAYAESGADWVRYSRWYVLSVGGTGFAMFLLSVAFGAVHLRGRSRVFAPIGYLISYVAFWFSFTTVLVAVGKADDWNEVYSSMMWGSLRFIGPAVIAAGVLLYWTTAKRSADLPLVSPPAAKGN